MMDLSKGASWEFPFSSIKALSVAERLLALLCCHFCRSTLEALGPFQNHNSGSEASISQGLSTLVSAEVAAAAAGTPGRLVK